VFFFFFFKGDEWFEKTRYASIAIYRLPVRPRVPRKKKGAQARHIQYAPKNDP